MSTTTTTTTTATTSSSSTASATTRLMPASASKARKGSKIVVLRLQPELLAQFAPKATKDEHRSSSEETATPGTTTSNIPTVKVDSTSDAASEGNSTPAPAADGVDDTSTTATDDPNSKKRKAPSSSSSGPAGSKKSTNLTVDKARGKPGPKKKAKLDDGTADSQPKPAAPAGAAHRLGPKAAEKAINAGLRALDRSGAPCRRWVRKPFQVKSFTGVTWDLPSWKGGEQQKTSNVDSSSEIQDGSLHSTSDVKPADSDTAMDSNAGDPMAISTPIPSSPPPAPILEQASVISAQG